MPRERINLRYTCFFFFNVTKTKCPVSHFKTYPDYFTCMIEKPGQIKLQRVNGISETGIIAYRTPSWGSEIAILTLGMISINGHDTWANCQLWLPEKMKTTKRSWVSIKKGQRARWLLKRLMDKAQDICHARGSILALWHYFRISRSPHLLANRAELNILHYLS